MMLCRFELSSTMQTLIDDIENVERSHSGHVELRCETTHDHRHRITPKIANAIEG